MATANDIITDALTRIGVYAPGETITDQDAQRCLSIMNDMLDQWSNENLSCYQILEQSVALTSGKSQYSIGSAGDVNVTRPLKLVEGPGAAYIQDSNGNNFSLTVVSRDKWNLIGNRSSSVTSNIPDTLFYDPQFPLGLLNFWPQPNAGGFTAFWDSYLQFVDFSALTTALSLPPGYKDAIQKNLAVEIWPDFKTGEIPQLIVMMADKAKATVKRTNIRSVEAVYDPELVSRALPTFNIYSGRDGGMV